MAGFSAAERLGGAKFKSDNFRAIEQHRAGLTISALRPTGFPQSDFLGDFELNRSDRHGPHDAVLDTLHSMYRAASPDTVFKGDKQMGLWKAARFDKNKVTDILRESQEGHLCGTEVKCLHTIKTVYSLGNRASHVDNGHLYAFGSTREGALQSLIGSKPRGLESDPYLDHSTGIGRVDKSDWTDTKSGRVKPVYKDAILN